VSLLATAALAGIVHVWMLYAFALVFGLADGFFFPAQSAIVPQITGGRRLEAANAVVQGLEQVALFVAPVLAGGNSLVLKPSEKDPSASLMLASLWAEAGLPVSGTEPQAAKPQAAPAPHHLPKRVVRLPQRISAADLKRTLDDLPGTFDLVDIRPPQAFADFSLPGSVNVDVAEVMQNPLYLKGPGPLILVDRDGSLAMAVGGVLSQKTWRPIKVLHGGLEAYVKELGLKPLGQAPSPPEPLGKAAPAPGAGGGKSGE